MGYYLIWMSEMLGGWLLSAYLVASNASVIRTRKSLISPKMEMRDFCLLRRCPKPRRTQVCVLETLEDSSGCAILRIA